MFTNIVNEPLNNKLPTDLELMLRNDEQDRVKIRKWRQDQKCRRQCLTGGIRRRQQFQSFSYLFYTYTCVEYDGL